MTTTPADTAPATAAGRARIGKALLWIAAAAAGGAALTAISAVLGADGATKIVETWRMCGLVVFTGLFALLALRPLPESVGAGEAVRVFAGDQARTH